MYNYTYDALRNILTVKQGTALLASYEYDSLNQLVRENNVQTNETYVYTYDNSGNILTAKTYAYTTGALGAVQSTNTYGYTDANWGDKLTSFNGSSFTYDASGNPLTYNNGSAYAFTWQNGRQLASLTKGSTNVSYKYNADGIRYEKTVNGVVHKYFLMGSTITAETIVSGNTATKLEYFYDDTGAYAFTYDGTMYYYVKNLQGDVTQIRDASNNLVVSYVYDAWGKLMSTTGSLASTVGAVNPIRYRGYYYDIESNLYYLNSRYYDPAIKRFVNADLYISTGQGFTGNNMFTYCNNNAIMAVDVYGYDAIWLYNNDAMGHSALLVQHENQWYYFFWGSNTVILRLVDDSSLASIDDFNNSDISSLDYTSIYFSGDFEETYKYCNELFNEYKANNSNGNNKYNVLSNNCSKTGITALTKSSDFEGDFLLSIISFYPRATNARLNKKGVPNKTCNEPQQISKGGGGGGGYRNTMVEMIK